MFQTKLPDLAPAPVGGSAQRRVEWVLEAVDKDHGLLRQLRKRANATRARLKERKDRQDRRKQAALDRQRVKRRDWLESRLPIAASHSMPLGFDAMAGSAGEAFSMIGPEGESTSLHADVHGATAEDSSIAGSGGGLRGRRPRSAAAGIRGRGSAGSLHSLGSGIGGSLSALPRAGGMQSARDWQAMPSTHSQSGIALPASGSLASLRPVSAVRRTRDGTGVVETPAVMHESLGVVSLESLQRACEGWVQGTGSRA